MSTKTVDLSAHINQDVKRGHPADFPVVLRKVYITQRGKPVPVPKRLAVVRKDNGHTLAVVSDRYRLIPHQNLLDAVGRATGYLDVGPVPRGIYVDRLGARMRALFKFPALAEPVAGGGDEICPCIQIQNTYDGTSRIGVQIGAFRFVCTNLAVGGGGVFAGGFMAVHAGVIPIDEATSRLADYLLGFSRIAETYRAWSEQRPHPEQLEELLGELPKRASRRIREAIEPSGSVYDAYNAATNHATHRMRSARSAFDLLDLINRGFQRFFPPSAN